MGDWAIDKFNTISIHTHRIYLRSRNKLSIIFEWILDTFIFHRFLNVNAPFRSYYYSFSFHTNFGWLFTPIWYSEFWTQNKKIIPRTVTKVRLLKISERIVMSWATLVSTIGFMLSTLWTMYQVHPSTLWIFSCRTFQWVAHVLWTFPCWVMFRSESCKTKNIYSNIFVGF